MNIDKILKLINAVQLNDINNNIDINLAIASDSLYDIMISNSKNIILVTSKIDSAIINAVEIIKIKCIVLTSGKRIDNYWINKATQNGISILRTKYSMFNVCGILYENGIRNEMDKSLLN